MWHIAREPGSEEYLDSEKYEIKSWGGAEDDLSELIGVINRIRKENTALQQNRTLKFHETDNDQIICYSKSADDNIVVTIVSLDPHNTQSGWVELDLEIPQPFQVHDLLSGARHAWQRGRNFVQLVPQSVPAHILRIRKRVRTERDFEYYL